MNAVCLRKRNTGQLWRISTMLCKGSNVEAARGALRSLIGEIPVVQTGRTLAARLTMRPGGLIRNPAGVL